MPTYKTEREAWQAVLDVLEGYGMPPECEGLCDVVWYMASYEAIDAHTELKMGRRIERELDKIDAGFYLARRYEATPRIPFVRKFMEECR